jgi:hypothetical protein
MRALEEKQWVQQVSCSGRGNGQAGCGSTLEVNKSDIRWYKGKSGDPSVDGTFFYAPEAAVVRCPVCATLTDLTEEERPADFRSCVGFSTKWRETGQDRQEKLP